MFGSIGGPELIVIFVVALLIFGPRKLPELGRMIGKGLSEFRRAANDLRDSLDADVARAESPSRGRQLPTAAAEIAATAGSAPATPSAGASGVGPPPATSGTAPADAASAPDDAGTPGGRG